jgi:hypothetical protein
MGDDYQLSAGESHRKESRDRTSGKAHPASTFLPSKLHRDVTATQQSGLINFHQGNGARPVTKRLLPLIL